MWLSGLHLNSKSCNVSTAVISATEQQIANGNHDVGSVVTIKILVNAKVIWYAAFNAKGSMKHDTRSVLWLKQRKVAEGAHGKYAPFVQSIIHISPLLFNPWKGGTMAME